MPIASNFGEVYVKKAPEETIDIDYRQALRMVPNGNVGIGPTFTISAPPLADLHILTEQDPIGLETAVAKLQMSVSGPVAGANVFDGFAIEVPDVADSLSDGQVILRQQENNALIIQSSISDSNVGLSHSERMRITTISDSVVDHPTTTLNAHTTRISISKANVPLTQPRSLLHLGLNMNNSASTNWRPWMNVGTLFTDGNEHVYVGLRDREGTGTTCDAIIGWGRYTSGGINEVPLRFVVNSNADAAADEGTIGHVNGKEVMRIESHTGFVGIGDYSVNGPNTGPLEIDATLDIDGDLRIRTLVDSVFDYILVADTGDLNRIYKMPVDSLNPEDCDWENIMSEDDVNENVFTGTAPVNEECLAKGLVGIGTSVPKCKLDVVLSTTAGNPNSTAICGTNMLALEPINYGVIGKALGSGANYNTAGYFEARNATQANVAIKADANSFPGSPIAARNYGVNAYASGASVVDIGIYSVVDEPVDYAGYFIGDVEVQGQLTVFGVPVLTSDESLKTDIQALDNCLETALALKPKSYYWNPELSDEYGFGNEQSFGYIAQEMQQILPSVVNTINVIPENDSDESTTILGIKYDEIIPILNGAIIEQQQVIVAQQAEIDNLKLSINDMSDNIQTLSTAISECCGVEIELKDGEQAEMNVSHTLVKQLRLDQNIPNPFVEITTIQYAIAQEGGVQIVVMDASGRMVTRLLDEFQSAGEYAIQWDASELSNGVYYYSLVIDGIELVRKAVKMQ